MGPPSGSRSRSRSPRDYRDSADYETPPADYGSDETGWRLHVAGLDPAVTKKDLEKAFQRCGTLKEIWLADSDPDYTVVGFAFVVFRRKEDAEAAVRLNNNTLLRGKRVRVSYGRPRRKPATEFKCEQCAEVGHYTHDCPDRQKFGVRRPRRDFYPSGHPHPGEEGRPPFRGGGGYRPGGRGFHPHYQHREDHPPPHGGYYSRYYSGEGSSSGYQEKQ